MLLAACSGAPAAAPSSSAAAPTSAAAPASGGASAKPAGSAAASAKPAGSGSTTSPAASGQLTKITAAYINVSGSNISLFVAREGGYFQTHGIDLDLQFINGAAKGMPALIAGQVQICHCGGSELVSANAEGADLVATATLTPVYPYKFEANPNIKTFQDLKGKPVGISSIGGAVDVVTRLELAKNGLDPDKDIIPVPDNGSTFRMDALLAGATMAAMADPPGLFKLEENGFHTLANPAADKLPTANSTITAQRAWVNANKDLMQRYVDAMVEANARSRRDKTFAVQAMKKYFQSTDDKVMGDTWDFFAKDVEPEVPNITVDQFKDSIEQLAKKNAKIASYDPSKAIDNSFVKSAADRGLAK
jgi:NitT/TauT family transport system substrate-binding protein